MQVASSKREREYARKRHEKWLARQAAARAQRRRRLVIGFSAVGVLLLAGAVVLALALTGGDEETARTLPDPSVAEDRTWTTTLATTAGDLTLELDGALAPQAVASFVTLAQDGFFDDTTCHRLTVSGIFVLQCGDPTGTGTGGPGYTFGPIENAPSDEVYPAGTVAMARPGGQAEGMGSQFFLVYEDSTIPADEVGGYTVMGRITEGMDVLQAVADAGIAEGTEQTPATEVTIEGVEVQ